MAEQDHDLHAMVGAYVADALDDDDRELFVQHLRGCESCRRESAEFAETLGELSWLAETPPPPSLRASVLAEIATVRPLPPEEPEQGPAEEPDHPEPVRTPPTETTVPRPWPAEAPPVAPSEDPAHYGETDELSIRRNRRLRRALVGLVAAALVLVVGLGGWVVTLRNTQQNQLVADQQVSQLLTAPDATVYATQLNGAPVSFVVSKQRNQALFVGDDVPAPGDNKVYQLWMIGDQITPNALIEQGGDVTQWFEAGPLGGAKQLAVTIEPAGGAMKPSLPPVAGVEL